MQSVERRVFARLGSRSLSGVIRFALHKLREGLKWFTLVIASSRFIGARNDIVQDGECWAMSRENQIGLTKSLC